MMCGSLFLVGTSSAQPIAYTITDLGTLGGDYTYTSAINASGQVTGNSTTFWGGGRAFLYANGQMTNLGSIYSSYYSSGNALNDLGQVAGSSQQSAILFSGNSVTDLNYYMGAATSYAYGINNSSQVVGVALGGSTYTAFLYSNGIATPLNDLLPPSERTNWNFTAASDINDLGWIVGIGYTNGLGRSGPNTAFLLHDGQVVEFGGQAVTRQPSTIWVRWSAIIQGREETTRFCSRART